MDDKKLTTELDHLIAVAKTAVFTTVSTDGAPRSRWVTPGLLRDSPGSVFFVTAPGSSKVAALAEHNRVSWLFQTPALDRVLRIDGTADVIDNPSLTSEVLEVVAPRLRVFWKINEDRHAFVVVETAIESAELFLPMKGTRDTFTRGKET